MKLYGNDDRGRPFTRKLSEIHKPSNVELSIKASTGRCVKLNTEGSCVSAYKMRNRRLATIYKIMLTRILIF